MNINLIKNVTYVCPSCNTSVKFLVEPNWETMNSLCNAVENLSCPKCKDDLSFSAKKVFQAIKAYNDSVQELLAVQKEYYSILD